MAAKRILLSGAAICFFAGNADAQVPAEGPGLQTPYIFGIPGGIQGGLPLPVPTLDFGLLGTNIIRPPTQQAPYNLMPYAQGALPEYEPLGITAGTFTVYPSATLQVGYNSNVFGTASGARADGIVTIAPEVIAISRGTRNALAIEAGGEFNRYLEYSSLKNDNGFIGLSDTYEIAPGKFISGGLSHELRHLDPAREETTVREPTKYRVSSMSAGFLNEPDRFGYRLDGLVSYFDYGPEHPIGGGSISQDDRDFTLITAAPTVFYQLTPLYTVFSRLTLNAHVYDADRDSAGFQRDSYGGTFDVGVAVDITRALSGSVYVGVLHQRYRDDRLGEQTAPNFGAALGWRATERSLYGIGISRSIEETRIRPTAEQFSALQTRVELSADYLLYPNVGLRIVPSYTRLDFQGPADRTDNEFDVFAAAYYFINRHARFGPEISFVHRDSDEPEARFERIVGLLRFTIQY
jgi:hypothetical protein